MKRKRQDEIPPNNPLAAVPRRRENANEEGTQAFGGSGGSPAEAPAPGATDQETPTGAPPSPLAARPSNGRLDALAETAKDYARNARADNTRRAYESDWRQFSSWLRRQGLPALPPDPRTAGLYLAACVDGSGRGTAPTSVATLERRLSGIAWHYRQIGEPLDTQDRHIATVLAGIRRAHGRPPVQKEAIFAEDLLAMLATLENDLRGLRDRAILAIGFAGGLRRSEIVGLDCGPDQSEDGTGWIEIFGAPKTARDDDDAGAASSVSDGGLLLTINGKTGWREVEIGRGSSPFT